MFTLNSFRQQIVVHSENPVSKVKYHQVGNTKEQYKIWEEIVTLWKIPIFLFDIDVW